MSLHRTVAVICGVLACSAWGEDRLLECSFDRIGKPEERKAWRGSFKGVLADGLEPDYLTRSEAAVVTTADCEDGVRFLRFKTENEASRFILSGQALDGLAPGFYRLTVRGRAVTAPLSADVKTVRWIGEWFFKGLRLDAPEWTESSAVFQVKERIKEPVSVSLVFGTGEADISYVSLTRADEKDYAAQFCRPAKGFGNLLRRRHFAFGLPNGWSFDCGSESAPVAVEGTALVVTPKGTCTFYSAPFQTDDPHVRCSVRFRYRSEKPWKVAIIDYSGRAVVENGLAKSEGWKDACVTFDPDPYTNAFSVRFKGGGRLSIDDVCAFSGDETASRCGDDICEIHLAPQGGDIGECGRVQFADERPMARYRVIGCPEGAEVKVSVADAYGTERAVAVPKAAEASFDWGGFPERPLGAFRITAWVEKSGKRVSRMDEMVMTRVLRPWSWGRDAPESRFGAHFLPRKDTILLMKAAGINWTRFHDSCTDLSGWYALEPEKGKWVWPDKKIRVFRENGISILAQLGTTPTWASHFGETGKAKMDYFDRWMRPTNSVDWVNYVTRYVRHYEGVINDYFIWNEPWWKWWCSAPDAKLYKHADMGRDFGILCSQAYAAAKAVNPNVNICGFNTRPDGGRWARQVMKGGAYEACDQMDFHQYCNATRCRRGVDSNRKGLAFRSVFEAHPDCKKPIYITEGGAAMFGVCSGLYRETVPWAPETRAQCIRNADDTVRYSVSFLAEGVSRIFIYTMHAYRALGVKPGYLKLLTADGFPHPSFAAHSFMAAMLDRRHFVEKREWGKEGLAYVFDGVEGRCTVFSGLDRGEAFALAGDRTLDVRDIFGNRLTEATWLPGTLLYATRGGVEGGLD